MQYVTIPNSFQGAIHATCVDLTTRHSKHYSRKDGNCQILPRLVRRMENSTAVEGRIIHPRKGRRIHFSLCFNNAIFKSIIKTVSKFYLSSGPRSWKIRYGAELPYVKWFELFSNYLETLAETLTVTKRVSRFKGRQTRRTQVPHISFKHLGDNKAGTWLRRNWHGATVWFVNRCTTDSTAAFLAPGSSLNNLAQAGERSNLLIKIHHHHFETYPIDGVTGGTEMNVRNFVKL